MHGQRSIKLGTNHQMKRRNIPGQTSRPYSSSEENLTAENKTVHSQKSFFLIRHKIFTNTK